MPELGRHVSPLLVGRDDLLALGERRIAEVAAGRGHMLLLAGEPGIGKSRFLRSLLERARTAGFRFAKGDVSPTFALVLLASLEDLFRDMAVKDFGDLGARLMAVDRSQGRDTLGSRRRLVADLVQVILEAIDRPTVLAFDDLQWVDELTLEVVGELARGSRGLPLLLVGAFRSGELPAGSVHREWRARLLTQRLAEELRVQRLTREETALVTTLVLDTGLPAPREVVDAVYARTNGIPLHIEELLAAVGDAATDGRAIRGAHVPDTIEDAVLAHAGRLSADARAVARAGAVMGRCFAPEALAGIMDRPIAELDEPLDELVKAGILSPFDFVDEGYYDFRHQLLRDALYDDVPARDLRRFHARAAEFGATLIGGGGDLSLHFERAGMREQAFRSAIQAADEALKVYSNREAFDLYRRAIENMPEFLSDAEKAAHWVRYSDLAGYVDRGDIGRDAALRGRELALRAGDATRAAEALFNLAVIARREGDPIADRRDLVRRVVLEAEALPDSEMKDLILLNCLDLLGIEMRDDIRFEEARSYYREMLATARELGMAEDVEAAQKNLWEVDILESGAAEPLRLLLESAATARAEGHETMAVNAYRDAAWFSVRTLHYADAGQWIGEGLKYSEEIEQSFCGHILASMQGVVSWAGGDWEAAAAQAGQAASDPGSMRSRATARWVLGWIAACRGDRRGAEAHLLPALDYGLRSGWLDLSMPAQWGLAEAALMSGDPEAAIARCEEVLAQARQRGEHGLLPPFVVTGVRAYQLAGRPDAAARYLDQMIRAIGPLAGVASPAIAHGRGLVKLAEGSIGPARDSLEAAIREWDERGRRWEALWARLDLAAADLRTNRYAEATALVREVRQAAETLGSQPLADRADHLTRLAKGRGAEMEPWHPLTVREFEVARKIAEGLTNAAIAEELFVSPKTVSAHVEHILAKLGASRRTEIAAWVSAMVAPASVA